MRKTIMLILLLSVCSPACGIYAETVIYHSPQAPDAFSPSVVLGSPDAYGQMGGPYYGETDFDEVDNKTTGFVIVDFGGKIVPDITEQKEIVIHLFDWHEGENEIFEVFAGMDMSNKSNWPSLGTSPRPFGQRYKRCSLRFDLSNGGLEYAKYIMVTNGRIDTNNPHDGPDIDAIEYVPEQATLLLLGLGGLMLGRRRRG